MFASYLAPHLNLSPPRRSDAMPSSDGASVATHSTAGSRGSRTSGGTGGGGGTSGSSSSREAKARDYRVLLSELRKSQAQFQRARSRLASSLLRMGEYHVRHGEYDEAVMALRDSVHENRIVVCGSAGGGGGGGGSPGTTTAASRPFDVATDGCEESLVSGMTGSLGAQTPRGGGGGPSYGHPPHVGASCSASLTPSTSSSTATSYLSLALSGDRASSSGREKSSSSSSSSSSPEQDPEAAEVHRESLDDMIGALSSLGKVHSLKGDDAAAMRYYDEKTKVQAWQRRRSTSGGGGASEADQWSAMGSSAGCLGGGGGVFFSEGHANIMNEINEDVRALDELFRGIGFGKDKEEGEDLEAERGGEDEVVREDDARNEREVQDVSPDEARSGHAFDDDPPDETSSPASHSREADASTSPAHSRTSRASADGSSHSRSRKSKTKGGDDRSSDASHSTHRRRRVRVSVDADEASRGGGQSPSSRSPQSSPRPPAPRMRRLSSRSTWDGTAHGLGEDRELIDALETYRAIVDAHRGRHRGIEKHEKKCAEFVRKSELLRAGTNASCTSCDPQDGSSPSAGGGSSSSAGSSSSSSASPSSGRRSARRKEWQLALAVREASLALQREVASANSRSSIPSFPPGTPRKRPASELRDRDVHAGIASALIAAGGLCYKLGHVERELARYREALAVYRESLGPDHPHVAGTLKNVGTVLAVQGRHDEAMECFREARRIYELACAAEGRRHGHQGHRRDPELRRDVASAISCMGNVHNRRGEFEEALALYGEALDVHRAAARSCEVGSEPSRLALREVASTLKIVGMVHAKRDDWTAAMACFQEAIDVLRGNFDEREGGPAVVSVLGRIGGVFVRMDKLDEAMSHYREAYDLAARTYGTAGRPEVAQVLHHIGGVHQRTGEFDEALRCYVESSEIYRTSLGKDDPTVATTLVCIGSLHYVGKNLDGAMEYYREALRLNRSAYGTAHPDVLPTMKSIALIHAKRGDYDEAVQVFQEVLEIKVGEVGPRHPEVAGAHRRIGNVRYRRGDLEGAREEYRKALDIYQESLGAEHPTTASAGAIVEKVGKELVERREREQRQGADGMVEETTEGRQDPPSTSFFKRAPKGYESL